MLIVGLVVMCAQVSLCSDTTSRDGFSDDGKSDSGKQKVVDIGTNTSVRYTVPDHLHDDYEFAQINPLKQPSDTTSGRYSEKKSEKPKIYLSEQDCKKMGVSYKGLTRTNLPEELDSYLSLSRHNPLSSAFREDSRKLHVQQMQANSLATQNNNQLETSSLSDSSLSSQDTIEDWNSQDNNITTVTPSQGDLVYGDDEHKDGEHVVIESDIQNKILSEYAGNKLIDNSDSNGINNHQTIEQDGDQQYTFNNNDDGDSVNSNDLEAIGTLVKNSQQVSRCFPFNCGGTIFKRKK